MCATTPTFGHGSANTEKPCAGIDPSATYLLSITTEPEAAVIHEQVMPGLDVDALIRAQLVLVPQSVDQDESGEMTLKALAGRTCTYSKVC